MKKIIDVSSNNGNISWDEVVNDGVSDVILRLSLGYGDKDKMAQKYAEGATGVGINVSYYHLAYPDTKEGGTVVTDARKEANYFTGLFQAGLMPSPKWLAVDLEKMNNGWDTPLNKTDYLKWVQVFLSQVYSNTGIVCWIYSNKPYLENHLPANHGLGFVSLWISNYNNVTSPSLPKGWVAYYLWQYSETGTIKGVRGGVDLNVLSGVSFIKRLRKKLLDLKSSGKKLLQRKNIKYEKILTDQLSLQDIYTKIDANNNSPFSKELIASICWAESSFKPDSTADTSTSTGLMMMNTEAVAIVNSNAPNGVHFYFPMDMFSPDLAIACGTWYLNFLFTKPDWNCKGDKRQTITAFRHGRNSTDYTYADLILNCEGCLQSTVVLNQQTCLNQIHT